MRTYTFGLTLSGSVTVEGASEDEARRIMEGFVNTCVQIELRSSEGDAVVGEAALPTSSLYLVEIDGEEV